MEVPGFTDTRLGRDGLGICVLPLGIVASFYSTYGALRGAFAPELLAFDSARITFIWLILLSAAAFFLMLSVGGCRILWQALHVVRAASGRENIVVKPFIGRPTSFALRDIIDVGKVGPHQPWIPMTLLSRHQMNWAVKLRDGQQYYINGELPDANEYFAILSADKAS